MPCGPLERDINSILDQFLHRFRLSYPTLIKMNSGDTPVSAWQSENSLEVAQVEASLCVLLTEQVGRWDPKLFTGDQHTHTIGPL